MEDCISKLTSNKYLNKCIVGCKLRSFQNINP